MKRLFYNPKYNILGIEFGDCLWDPQIEVDEADILYYGDKDGYLRGGHWIHIGEVDDPYYGDMTDVTKFFKPEDFDDKVSPIGGFVGQRHLELAADIANITLHERGYVLHQECRSKLIDANEKNKHLTGLLTKAVPLIEKARVWIAQLGNSPYSAPASRFIGEIDRFTNRTETIGDDIEQPSQPT